jgi:hypothetical protein
VRKGSVVLPALALILRLLLPLVGCNRESYFKLFGYDRNSLLYKFTPFTPLAIEVPPVVARVEVYGPWSIDIFAPLGAIEGKGNPRRSTF